MLDNSSKKLSYYEKAYSVLNKRNFGLNLRPEMEFGDEYGVKKMLKTESGYGVN